MKTVTFWISVQGGSPASVIFGEWAWSRKAATECLGGSYAGGWAEAQSYGWRVCKVTVPWEQVKP